jgi:hypothetical protein
LSGSVMRHLVLHASGRALVRTDLRCNTQVLLIRTEIRL